MRTAACILLFAATAAGAQPRSASDLERAGWDAIRASEARQAADAFAEALRHAPRNPRVILGAGLAAYLLGQMDEARVHLVDALRIQPSLTGASVLLGQLLYRSGDLDAAIEVYEQAAVHAPDDAILISRLDAWRGEARLHGGFSQRLGNYFTVLFEGPAEAETAERALELLEAAYWRIGTAFGAYPRGVITVVLYTREQFRDVTRSPAWAAGAFDGRIRLPVHGALENPRELERVLAHEFTHALVYSIAPRGVPHWLNEGLAALFEPGGGADAAEPAEGRAGGPPIPLARLERPFKSLDEDQARRAYAASLAAVRALVDRVGVAGIVNLLTNLGDSMPFDEAFARAVFLSYEDFQRAWLNGAG